VQHDQVYITEENAMSKKSVNVVVAEPLDSGWWEDIGFNMIFIHADAAEEELVRMLQEEFPGAEIIIAPDWKQAKQLHRDQGMSHEGTNPSKHSGRNRAI
jgi:hypothetical protein